MSSDLRLENMAHIGCILGGAIFWKCDDVICRITVPQSVVRSTGGILVENTSSLERVEATVIQFLRLVTDIKRNKNSRVTDTLQKLYSAFLY